jgi:hypothetical protein
VKSRHLHRVAVRFPRTTSEAFKDYTYGAAVEKPLPSFWRQLVNLILGRTA